MRTIKFRAWDKKNKKMSIVFDIWQIDMDNSYNTWLPGLGKVYEDDIELMQYTGLKDKNGKEIYEGDIVESEGKPSEKWSGFLQTKFRFPKGHRRIIIFHDGSFKMTKKSKRSKKQMFFGMVIHRNSFKVIGNIYENPELLNK